MENEWRRFLCSFKFLSHFTLILKIPLSPYHNEMQPIQQWMQANASLSNRCTCTYVNMNKMFKYFASNWTVFFVWYSEFFLPAFTSILTQSRAAFAPVRISVGVGDHLSVWWEFLQLKTECWLMRELVLNVNGVLVSLGPKSI